MDIEKFKRNNNKSLMNNKILVTIWIPKEHKDFMMENNLNMSKFIRSAIKEYIDKTK